MTIFFFFGDNSFSLPTILFLLYFFFFCFPHNSRFAAIQSLLRNATCATGGFGRVTLDVRSQVDPRDWTRRSLRHRPGGGVLLAETRHNEGAQIRERSAISASKISKLEMSARSYKNVSPKKIVPSNICFLSHFSRKPSPPSRASRRGRNRVTTPWSGCARCWTMIASRSRA